MKKLVSELEHAMQLERVRGDKLSADLFRLQQQQPRRSPRLSGHKRGRA